MPKAGSIVTHVGPVPVAVEADVIAPVGFPEFWSIVYAPTVPDEKFATYRNLPRGSTVTPTGNMPVGNWLFTIGVSEPSALVVFPNSTF